MCRRRLIACERSLQDLRLNKNNAAADHAERACCARRNVKYAMLAEWTPIVDGDGDAAAGFRIADAEPSSKWQRFMRRGHAVASGGIEGAKSRKAVLCGLRERLYGQARRQNCHQRKNRAQHPDPPTSIRHSKLAADKFVPHPPSPFGGIRAHNKFQVYNASWS